MNFKSSESRASHTARSAYVHKRTETKFKVFHSRSKESTNTSHDCLNLESAGDTVGGFQLSGNGNAVSPLLFLVVPNVALNPRFAPSPVATLSGACAGAQASIIR